MLDPNAIYTDAHGKPFERPQRPAWLDDPTTPRPLSREQLVEHEAYWRAWADYEQRVLGHGNRAFADELRRTLRQG